MAVPGVNDWQGQILTRLGFPSTPQNFKVLNAWAQAEGGSATNNPFNTTEPMPGATSYNSVGVRNYQTPAEGINATVKTLQNGRYANILSGLKAGNSPTVVAQAIANSPWGTGNGVLNVLGSTPTPSVPANLPSSGLPATIPKPQTAQLLSAPIDPMPMDILSGLQSHNLLGGVLSGLMQGQALGTTASTPTTSIPLGGKVTGPLTVGTVKTGDPLPAKYQTSVGGLHPTEGLPGFPAHDYMAPAGSPVVAPVTGTIVKLSGHNPSEGPTEGPHGPFGWSVYVQGTNGRTYYLTHLGSRDVKVGETIKSGQLLGTVGNYAKYGTPSHVHMGVSAPGVSVS